MKQLTQTNLDPGNCWQTCIAMLLDVDPESMPPQEKFIERRDYKARKPYFGHISYSNALNAYLMKHHGLVYFEIDAWKMAALPPVKGLHILSGETVRTPDNKSDHVVMGEDGEMVWDPHPSRAGLTKIKFFEFLAAPNESIRKYWLQEGPALDRQKLERERLNPKEPAFITHLCCCPRCLVGGEYQ